MRETRFPHPGGRRLPCPGAAVAGGWGRIPAERPGRARGLAQNGSASASAPPPARGEGREQPLPRFGAPGPHGARYLPRTPLPPARRQTAVPEEGGRLAAGRSASAATHLPPAVRRPRSPSTLVAWAAPVTSRAKLRHRSRLLLLLLPPPLRPQPASRTPPLRSWGRVPRPGSLTRRSRPLFICRFSALQNGAQGGNERPAAPPTPHVRGGGCARSRRGVAGAAAVGSAVSAVARLWV